MAKLINVPLKEDTRGSLTVVEKCLPFDIKRVFTIFNVPPNTIRGGHAHKKTQMALICQSGACEISWQTPSENHKMTLEKPTQCLLLNPEDWHQMEFLKENTILLVLASENYDANDYIYEAYR